MDYCSTCRRHVNGALVCPGCGVYALDTAPGATDGHTVPPTATAAAEPAAGVMSEAAQPDETASPTAAPSYRGTGRAARRRQMTRWKKTQRRALVATAVALVGGGLTVSSMDRGSGDSAQAATAPDFKGMGGARGPADTSTDPGFPTNSPERSPEQTAPADDAHRTPAGATQESTNPSRTHTDSGSDTPAESESRSRTTAPDSTSRSYDRSGERSGERSGDRFGERSGHRPGGRHGTNGNGDFDRGMEARAGSGTGTGTGTSQTSSPPPASDDGNTGGGTHRDDTGDSPSATSSTPPPDASESSRLCVLGICLG